MRVTTVLVQNFPVPEPTPACLTRHYAPVHPGPRRDQPGQVPLASWGTPFPCCGEWGAWVPSRERPAWAMEPFSKPRRGGKKVAGSVCSAVFHT